MVVFIFRPDNTVVNCRQSRAAVERAVARASPDPPNSRFPFQMIGIALVLEHSVPLFGHYVLHAV